MSRQVLLSIIGCLAIAGCTALVSSDYQHYEGKNNVHEGTGDTKVVVNGVDFWANGSPPRKFAILGVVTSEVGAGFGDQALIRSSVASRAKHVGGDAAVQITSFVEAPNHLYDSICYIEASFVLICPFCDRKPVLRHRLKVSEKLLPWTRAQDDRNECCFASFVAFKGLSHLYIVDIT